jgi:hypothetical protein
VKETYKSKFNNCTTKRFNNYFKERFKQYVIKYKKGSNKDLKAKANNAFKSLILNIKFKLNYKKELKLSTAYFTAFKKLMLSKATSISIVLANKAFSYSLTLKDITEPTLATNFFIYTLNTFSS